MVPLDSRCCNMRVDQKRHTFENNLHRLLGPEYVLFVNLDPAVY